MARNEIGKIDVQDTNGQSHAPFLPVPGDAHAALGECLKLLTGCQRVLWNIKVQICRILTSEVICLSVLTVPVPVSLVTLKICLLVSAASYLFSPCCCSWLLVRGQRHGHSFNWGVGSLEKKGGSDWILLCILVPVWSVSLGPLSWPFFLRGLWIGLTAEVHQAWLPTIGCVLMIFACLYYVLCPQQSLAIWAFIVHMQSCIQSIRFLSKWRR